METKLKTITATCTMAILVIMLATPVASTGHPDKVLATQWYTFDASDPVGSCRYDNDPLQAEAIGTAILEYSEAPDTGASTTTMTVTHVPTPDGCDGETFSVTLTVDRPVWNDRAWETTVSDDGCITTTKFISLNGNQDPAWPSYAIRMTTVDECNGERWSTVAIIELPISPS